MLDPKEFVKRARDAGNYVLDIETIAPFGQKKSASLDPHTGKIQGIAVEVEGETAYWAFGSHSPTSFQRTMKELKPLLTDKDVSMIGHNLSFDTKWLRQHGGYRIRNKLIDTMVASWLVNEDRQPRKGFRGKYGLKKLCYEHFGHRMDEFADTGSLFGPKVEDYAQEDVRWTRALWEHYEPELVDDEVIDVFHKIEMPLVHILAEMELTGMPFCPKAGRKHRANVLEKMGRLERKLIEQMGFIKLGSDKDVSRILYEEGWLDRDPETGELLDTMSRIPTDDVANDREVPRGKDKRDGSPGDFSSKKEVLALFKHEFPLIEDLLEHRHYGVLMNTFIDKLIYMSQTNPTRRIHGSFNQTGTKIGRLSSARPNMQNMPRPDDQDNLHDSIRGCFIEDEGFSLVDRDLSQIELRMMAHWSEDPLMLSIYKTGGICPSACEPFVKKGKCRHIDIHTATAEAINILRQVSKGINFGACYRIGPKRLRTYADVPTTGEARRFLQDWYDTYDGVVEFHEWVERELKRNSWKVRSITGRLRRLLKESKINDYRAVTQGIQFIISGSSQDLLKIAMRNMYQEILDRSEEDPLWDQVRMTCQVHDQVTARSPDPIAEEVYNLMGRCMESADSGALSVPILSEGGWGRSWVEAH